jgi:hypothetical protein
VAMTGEKFDQIQNDAIARRAAAAATPAGIANTLGQAGVPVAAALVLADIIVTLRSCIDQQAGMIHVLQNRVNTLDTAPAHLRFEKRG